MSKEIGKDLSIIVPIYNVEKYLYKCLSNLYKLKIKKEIILINDESLDNSYIIINKFQKLYPHETIVINQKNKGLSGARNSGLEIAKGEYIAFIDSDDFIDNKKFEIFFNMGKNKQLDIMMGTYRRYQNGKNLNICKRNKKINNLGIVDGKEFFKKSIKLNSFKEEVWDDIYSREFLLKNNLSFRENLIHEDTLFFIQALNRAERVEYFNIPFYFYRQRSGSITSVISKKNLDDKMLIIDSLLEGKIKKEIKLEYLNSFLISLLWGILINHKSINIKMIKKILLSSDKYRVRDYIKILLMLLAGLKFKYV